MVRTPRAFATLALCVLAAIVIAGASVFHVEYTDREREYQALSDSKMLGLAAIQFAQDHNNRYPDAGRWEHELAPYLALNGEDIGRIVHPTAPFGGTPRRFSLNPALSGKPLGVADSGNTWMFYESVSTMPSASDALDNWPDPDRDGGQVYAVVYGDGHSYSRPFVWKEGIRQHLPGL